MGKIIHVIKSAIGFFGKWICTCKFPDNNCQHEYENVAIRSIVPHFVCKKCGKAVSPDVL